MQTEHDTIETDLTDEECAIIQQGRKEYAQGGYVPFSGAML